MQQRSCCCVVNINFSACRPEVAGWIPGFTSLLDETFFKLWPCLNMTLAVGGTLSGQKILSGQGLRYSLLRPRLVSTITVRIHVNGCTWGVYWNDYGSLNSLVSFMLPLVLLIIDGMFVTGQVICHIDSIQIIILAPEKSSFQQKNHNIFHIFSRKKLWWCSLEASH